MYKLIILILISVLVLACSKSEDAPKSNISEVEKNLQNDIQEMKSKYDELDEYQKLIRDDIQNQVISIGCSTDRLIKLKNLESAGFKNKITLLIKKTKFLDAYTENGILIKNRLLYDYKYKPNLTINFKDIVFYDNKDYIEKNGEISYQNTVDKSTGIYYGNKEDLIKITSPQNNESSDNQDEVIVQYKNRICSTLYKRTIPNSAPARMAESKAFEEEIAYAIKRIDSFEARIEILEQLASQFTVYESHLNRQLQEYYLDKNNSESTQTNIDSFKKIIANAEEKIKLIKQNAKIQVTEKEVEAIRNLFL